MLNSVDRPSIFKSVSPSVCLSLHPLMRKDNIPKSNIEFYSYCRSPSLSSSRSPSRLSLPRISLTAQNPLLDAQTRTIEIDKLEHYILGKKSVELEIEFGISRHQVLYGDRTDTQIKFCPL